MSVSTLESRLVAACPHEDDVQRAVRLARVTRALVGRCQEVRVGRYVVSRELGTGGGGSVFEAYDPELGRNVAVKLVACFSLSAKARALNEARRLARLSHPHVVPIHDVGETLHHVYMVMEYLAGPSLRDFAKRAPTTHAIISAYLEAAKGLAAMHAAGLVHRDFKPDNALFGADGRVRLVDFGLATVEADGQAVGTPGYMAPDQADGTPAIDQFAFGISLREALANRSVPHHIERLLARASAIAPNQRYASMQAVIDALTYTPRRRLLVAGGVTVLLLSAGAFSAGNQLDAQTCVGGPEVLAEVLPETLLTQVHERFSAMDSPLAKALSTQTETQFNELRVNWLATHRAACERHRRQELSEVSFHRTTVCLAGSRATLRELSGLLKKASVADVDDVHTAVMAVDNPARCLESESLATPVLNHPQASHLEELQEIALFHTRASTPDAPTHAAAAVDAARRMGDKRQLARALLTLGQARMLRDLEHAAEPLEEAMQLALAHDADVVAVEAWARLAWTRGRKKGGDLASALMGEEVVVALSQRLGNEGRFARALLYNNRGSLKATSGAFEEARADFRRAMELGASIDGPRGAELSTAISNLAITSKDAEERARLHQLALERLRALVGPDDAQTLDKEMTAAFDSSDATRVRTTLATLCPRMAVLRPALHRQRNRCALEWAWQAFALGDFESVRAAAALVDPDATETNLLLSVWSALATREDMTRWIEQLRVEASRSRSAAWYEHLYAADAELALSVSESALGRHRAAFTAASRASTHLEQALNQTRLPYGVLTRRRDFALALQRRRGGRAETNEP